MRVVRASGRVPHWGSGASEPLPAALGQLQHAVWAHCSGGFPCCPALPPAAPVHCTMLHPAPHHDVSDSRGALVARAAAVPGCAARRSPAPRGRCGDELRQLILGLVVRRVLFFQVHAAPEPAGAAKQAAQAVHAGVWVASARREPPPPPACGRCGVRAPGLLKGVAWSSPCCTGCPSRLQEREGPAVAATSPRPRLERAGQTERQQIFRHSITPLASLCLSCCRGLPLRRTSHVLQPPSNT